MSYLSIMLQSWFFEFDNFNFLRIIRVRAHVVVRKYLGGLIGIGYILTCNRDSLISTKMLPRDSYVWHIDAQSRKQSQRNPNSSSYSSGNIPY